MIAAITAGLSQRKIDLLASALVVALAAPFAFRKVNPLLRPPGELAERRSQLHQLRRSSAHLAESLRRHREALAETRRLLAEEKRRLLSAGNVNGRIARLTSLAEDSGLAVDEIVPVEGRRMGFCLAVPVRVKASGSFPTCVAFLRRLKAAFPDTAVAAFGLYGTPEDPRQPVRCNVYLLWHTARP